MPIFRYRAYNNGGKTVAGSLEATGFKDALQRLKNTGLHPTDLSEAESVRSGYFGFKSLSPQLLAITTRQLSTLLSTGTNLSEALSVLTENAGNPRLKSILLKVNEKVMQGSSFARALEEHPEVFSTFYIGLVAAGEASGSLDKVLPRLADYLDTRARILRDVKAALTYPALMCVVGAGVLSFLFIFVIPKITRIFDETQNSLPLITIFLMGVTGIVRKTWPFLAGLIAITAVLARKYWNHRRIKELKDRLILDIPLIGGIVKDFYVSNFARTLGSLLKGGVQMLKALDITKEALNNSAFDEILDDARRDCMGGSSLSSSLKKQQTIHPIVVHMISVGERSGNLDDMLLKTADSYEQEFESGVKRMLNLLEPLLILTMGLVVGFIVLAILLPIFQLNQIVR